MSDAYRLAEPVDVERLRAKLDSSIAVLDFYRRTLELEAGLSRES
jgi:hypothetical protein